MTLKFQIEKRIFDLVYKSQTKFKITHQDKPDFIVDYAGNKFGVEITELYTNESSARLKNIPNYTEQLLDERKYRHKKDKDILKVDEIVIRPQDGTQFKKTAIIEKLPKPLEYLEYVKDRIKSKSELKKGYASNLSHVNLIINDNSSVFALIEEEEFYNFFFTDEMIEVLLESDFNEIFLVAKFKNGEVIQRLKLILLTSRIFLFHEIFKHHDVKNITPTQYYQYLTEFLINEGLKGIRIRNSNGATELIYCNIGFYVENFKDLTFNDYGDFDIGDGVMATVSDDNFVTENIQQIIFKIKKSFGFSTNVGVHV